MYGNTEDYPSTPATNVTTVLPMKVRIGNKTTVRSLQNRVFPVTSQSNKEQLAPNKKSMNKTAIVLFPLVLLLFNVIYFILTT